MEFPSATYYTVNGAESHLHQKVKQTSISSLTETLWSQILTSIPLAGMPKANECLFYHQPSKSLIVSDLLFNIENLDGKWLNLFARMMGFADNPSPSRLFKAMIKDKQAFVASLTKVMEHDFEQILTSHFNCIDTDGKAAIEKCIDSIS